MTGIRLSVVPDFQSIRARLNKYSDGIIWILFVATLIITQAVSLNSPENKIGTCHLMGAKFSKYMSRYK